MEQTECSETSEYKNSDSENLPVYTTYEYGTECFETSEYKNSDSKNLPVYTICEDETELFETSAHKFRHQRITQKKEHEMKETSTRFSRQDGRA
jgi:hypothetical protein